MQVDLRPPHELWRPLPNAAGDTVGYVSVYLSDPLARYPVRAVTRPRDNKSDPNLETGTYGLFSTCQVRMRKSIVTKGVRYAFFVTTHGRRARALTGYYDIAWFTPGPDLDFALAARAWRFVVPIPATTLPGHLRKVVELRRGYVGLSVEVADELRQRIESATDITARYVTEIRRLEALSARHTGYRYPTWRREGGWDWTDAPTYLAEPALPATGPVSNRAPDDRWICGVCTQPTINAARLKRCPQCGALGSLRPSQKEE